MNLLYLALSFFTLCIALAQTTTSTTSTSYKVWPTSVWVTATRAGVTTVFLSQYDQKFTSMYSTVAVPKSGSIGLGTISGTVGTVKPLQMSTMTVASSQS